MRYEVKNGEKKGITLSLPRSSAAKTPAVVKPKPKDTPPVIHVIQPATPEDYSDDGDEEDPRMRRMYTAAFSDPRKASFVADPYDMDQGMDPRFPHAPASRIARVSFLRFLGTPRRARRHYVTANVTQ